MRWSSHLFVGVSMVLWGCGDDDGSTKPDASAGGVVECQQLTLPAVAHLEQVQIVQAPPAGKGGTLRDGNYELTAHVRYRTTQVDGEPTSMRAALRLRNGATVMDYSFDEGSPGEPDSPRGFTARVTARENTLMLEMVCPEMRSTSVTFTAAGDELSVFEEDEETRFARR